MKKRLSLGIVQVYTGDGKGKTTAALGQAFRAVGRGYTVKMIQFLKSTDSGELHSVEKLHPDFVIYRFETQKKFFWTMNEEEKEILKGDISKGMEFARRILKNEECNILILDEVLGALHNDMITLDSLRELISMKPSHMELIITGRNLPEEILTLVDLVTEMKMIKHPLDKGIPSRDGIEK